MNPLTGAARASVERNAVALARHILTEGGPGSVLRALAVIVAADARIGAGR